MDMTEATCRKEMSMARKPCGNRECRRYLEQMGYDEANDEVCYQCGFDGPFFRYMSSQEDGEEDYGE